MHSMHGSFVKRSRSMKTTLGPKNLWAFLFLISPDPQPPVAGCASPTAEHTAT